MTIHARKIVLALVLLMPSFAALAATSDVEKNPDGVTLPVPGGSLRVQLLSDSIARVAFAKDHMDAFMKRESLPVLPQTGMTKGWQTSSDAKQVVLRTANLKVVIDRRTGAVSFFDAKGNPVLAEVPGSRTLTPTIVQGEQTAHVQQKWVADAKESLYGLAQRQLGMLDIKGYDLDLWQRNTHVVSPYLVSSKGYGIFWDNLSYTRFGDLRPFEPIPTAQLFDAKDQPGGFTQTALDGSEATKQVATINIRLPEGKNPRSYRWEGQVLAPMDGDYQFKTTSNGGIKVWIDGKLVIDHWRQTWLTDEDQVKVRFESGKRYTIKVETDNEQQNTVVLTWKTPSADTSTSLWSDVADGSDYYFVYGPKLDDVVAGVRKLTGKATMLPSWCFGLWQSRQRYETQQASLDVVNEFRRRQIPFDNIVQDWQYWKLDSWGSHQFEASRFPDPEGWIKAIHAANAHLMISVWGKFNPNTDLAKELIAKGFLYPTNLKEKTLDWMNLPHSEYDAYNPAARALFWKGMNERLFKKGIDAWWMDATEPDMFPSPPTLELQKKHMNPTYLGTASRVLNGYALQNSLGVYSGQRTEAPNQRVFILTRSGYTGQQRYATATWSGDITSTWTSMAKQIPAGLGFSITGVPYWATDTAGYTMQAKWNGIKPKPEDEEEWRELNTRWFQWSAFTPLLRVHGENRPREMWTMGGDQHPAYQAHVKADRLRYRLFPYIYSVAGAVTHKDDTMMRPLVMDFPKDAKARTLTDEYQFGPAFLVAPVTTPKARRRAVYLPAGAEWYDFWSGKPAAGGTTVDAPAPLDEMPLFVKAGAIVPVGPELQYIGEKPSDPTTLYIYQGADGAFTIYEDSGVTYDYEKGAFSEIPLQWNNASKTLTIGARKGTFPGMLEKRTFHIVVVSKTQATGFSFEPKTDKTVAYEGKALTIKL
jgi:alpha-D-xyloside xylohydrolase